VVDERHAVENAQFQPYMESNRNFHMALISKAKNALMKKLYVQVFDQLVIFLTLYEDFYEVETEYESSIQEHQSICDAMAKSSFKELERLVYMHEASTIKSLHLEKIKSRDLKEILLK
jgi:DNA-binding GntR family transcriptional regulator